MRIVVGVMPLTIWEMVAAAPAYPRRGCRVAVMVCVPRVRREVLRAA